MPIYEYECQACGHRLEALQKITEDPLSVCPACEQAALKKLVSASAFRLGGSGWYETDFKSGNKKNLAGDVSNSDKNTAGSSDNASASTKPKDTSKASSNASA